MGSLFGESELAVQGMLQAHSINTQNLARGAAKRQRQSASVRQIETEQDELIEPTEKKRRLTAEQVQFLESSFNQDLKLEPERKALIAKQLGLRPRQVAIWFQNRRARWKNKQAELDFDALKAKYDEVLQENAAIIKENQATLQENKRLQAEVNRLRSLLRVQDSEDNYELSHGSVVTAAEKLVNSDSGMIKEEQTSVKSEFASPTKCSEEQSEVQDSGWSNQATSLEATGMDAQAALLSLGELQSAATCSSSKQDFEHTAAAACSPQNLELEYQGIGISDDLFGNLVSPLLYQQLITNGVIFEGECNLVFNWEDQYQYGHAW